MKSDFVRPTALAGLFVMDRWTKNWAMGWLQEHGPLPVAPFLHLTYVENTGAAFGIGRARNGFFIGLSLALLGGLFYLQRSWPKENRWLQAGVLLVMAGAVGNLYDRLAYGFVVDFLDFRVWPVFNIADSCVTTGAACLAWGLRKEEGA